VWYIILADVIVAAHVAYASFIVVGQVLILIGLCLKWAWIRNPWFRMAHLAAILIVAIEALIGMDCPLTLWEAQLRNLGGQEASEGTFIGRCLDHLLFYDVNPAILNAGHIAFALLVLATLVVAPPTCAAAARSPGTIMSTNEKLPQG
jgi:hypothetical protein